MICGSIALGKNRNAGAHGMADQDYYHLDPSKMGFKFMGALPRPEQDILYSAFDLLRNKMGDKWDEQLNRKEIFWINVWQKEGSGEVLTIPDQSCAAALDHWCRAALERYAEPGAIMDGYGFVINPAGSEAHQVWHIDYTTDSAAIWIPLTAFTHQNATQFISLPYDAPRAALERLASNVDEVDLLSLEREVEHLIVQQIAAHPMSVLSMGRGTIHRGIANSAETDRIAFYISMHFIHDYTSYPYGEVCFGEPELVVFG
jgi:hypothetical protein